MSIFRRLIKEERGQVAILFALLFMVILGLAAIVIDVGILYAERRHAQNAADAAALAGARELPYDPDEAKEMARKYAALNGFDNAAADIEVTPTVSTRDNENDTIEVTVRNEHVTIFLAHIPFGGDNFRTVAARAVAQVGPPGLNIQPWGIANPCCQEDPPTDICGTDFDCDADCPVPFGFEFGEVYTIKAGAGSGASGNFGIIRPECVPPDCGGSCGGTSQYIDAIIDGSQRELAACEDVCCEGGAVGQNTYDAICTGRLYGTVNHPSKSCDLVCPPDGNSDCWLFDEVVDPDTNELRDDGPGFDSKRLVIIPIVKDLCSQGTSDPTQIQGFALFFIENITYPPNMELQGRFVKGDVHGVFTHGPLDYGLKTIRLME